MDGLALVGLLAFVCMLVLASSGGRAREDPRSRGRWDARFEHESRRTIHTDATGMLMCRSCGASAPERAGRCPSCGAWL